MVSLSLSLSTYRKMFYQRFSGIVQPMAIIVATKKADKKRIESEKEEQREQTVKADKLSC